jgi:prepilin signal peptidase PulO-like enzyme (type II secretory pathway)
MDFAASYHTMQELLLATMPVLPLAAWWIPALVLIILATTAVIDAFTSTVPDPLIFIGMLATVAAEGFYVSWPFAASNLTIALIAAVIIWGVNQLWYRQFKHDAIGMGDAKWTLLAITAFGALPAIFAWGGGACLAVIWIALSHVVRKPARHVHFAPFLYLGLVAGLCWLQLR